MLVTNIAGSNAAGAAPIVGKAVVFGLSVGLGWGVLSVLAAVAVGGLYLCGKYADSLDERAGDVEA